MDLRRISMAAFAVVTLAARSAWADGYEEIMARAGEAAARGDHRGAAKVLDPAVAAYPQDWAIAIECAWQHFQAEEWSDAERMYRETLARAPGSKDAAIGLGWSLLHAGRCEDAQAEAKKADDPRAKEIEAACAPIAAPWTLRASFVGMATPDHPIKSGAGGFGLGVSGPIGVGGVFGASYRFTRTATTASSGVAAFDQSEAYGHVGWWGERWGLVVRGGVVADGSGALKTSAHAGFSAHVGLASFLPKWTGDARLDFSVSVYDDAPVVRVAPSWALHVYGPLHVIPGFAVQADGARGYGNGSLAVALEWPAFSAWLGGKVGDEKRPAYLAQGVVYDLSEIVAGGVWLGVRVRPWKALGFEATYALDWLRRTDALAPAQSGLHTFTFGPVVTF